MNPQTTITNNIHKLIDISPLLKCLFINFTFILSMQLCNKYTITSVNAS